MKITNKTGLPEPIVQALSKDDYNKGARADYSVTQILRPPQMVALQRRYSDQIEMDASEMIWSLMGKSVHYVIERQSGGLSEQRFYGEWAGKILSGQIDHYAEGVLTDYKVTSAWSKIYGSRTQEWEEQLNCYAALMRRDGYEITQLQIVAFYRDWSWAKAIADPSQYPQAAIEIMPFDLWPEAIAEEFIEARIKLHEEQNNYDPTSYTPCARDEKWPKPDVWAVMKEGRKSAVKLHETEEAAIKHVNELGAKHYVTHRLGENTRCERYCSVKDFCKQREREAQK